MKWIGAIYLKRFKSAPQKYLLSSNQNTNEIQTLVNMRTFMLSDSKMNFKGSNQNNLWCKIFFLFPETQRHIFECFVLRGELKNEVNFDEFCYEHIDGTLDEQEQFAKVCTKILMLRRELISKKDGTTSEDKDQSTEDLDDSLMQIF